MLANYGCPTQLAAGTRCMWTVLPQDVFTDEPAVVTVGAGDEEEDLPSILHAAQPGLDIVRAGLQVPARVPLHTGEVGPSIICKDIMRQPSIFNAQQMKPTLNMCTRTAHSDSGPYSDSNSISNKELPCTAAMEVFPFTC